MGNNYLGTVPASVVCGICFIFEISFMVTNVHYAESTSILTKSVVKSASASMSLTISNKREEICKNHSLNLNGLTTLISRTSLCQVLDMLVVFLIVFSF